MNGILLIDKPQGWTSFDVVNYVRKIVARIEGKKPRNIKVGHTGTLDPMATGLLVVCVGKYTKKVPELIKQNKTYIAEITLGAFSDTDDAEGRIEPKNNLVPEQSEVESILRQHEGLIEQTPPAYSAVKIDGKRAYELARAGKEVKIKPRMVKVNVLKLLKYVYPKLSFQAEVGSGTYIRSLARSIGVEVGTGAYLSELRRTTVGEYKIENALTPEVLSEEYLKNHLSKTD